ncbi:MAG TPA: hypothetical protein VFW62_13555, partial [bacterium]|nr:hypothetical protein [bacterium]
MKTSLSKIFPLIFPALLLLGASSGPGEPPAGQAMMWKQPATSAQNLDLFWGSGSEAGKPAGPFVYDGEDSMGTNPKIFVKDQRGVRWGVKFGDEVHSEVAGSRFLWAAGYRTHEMYFVPRGIIQGMPDSLNAPPQIEKGSGKFTNARFKKRTVEAGVAKVEDRFTWWDWNDNPFVGTKELSGLILMNVLTSNFDTATTNNMVQTVYYKDGRVENWYMIGDIGGVFGQTGGTRRNKWSLEHYAKEPFIEKVTEHNVKLHHAGGSMKHFQSVPLEHAHWFYGIVGGLQPSQVEA